MKKIIFVALGAISIVVAGMLVVACTPDVANSPDVQVNEVVQRAPAAAEQGSEDAWADFNAQVEALNAKYTSQSRAQIEPVGNLRELVVFQRVVYADARGGLLGENYSTANNATPNNGLGTIISVAALQSCIEYYYFKDTLEMDTTDNDFTIWIRSTNLITDLTPVSNPCIEIGKRHNELVSYMVNNNYTIAGKSRPQIFREFVEAYEQLYTPMTTAYKQRLLTQAIYDRVPILNSNVTTANENYKNTTTQMSIPSMRNYTNEYIQIVDGASLSTVEKTQMSLFACIAYYSSCLWIVQ